MKYYNASIYVQYQFVVRKVISKKKYKFIYATEWGRYEWEENARCNSKRKIESLQNGIPLFPDILAESLI